MNPSTTGRVALVLRWCLGLLFAWAAVSKLANPSDFLGSVYAYQLPLPKALLQWVAVVLPWIELLCGLLLLANVWTESSLALAFVLMLCFLIATGQAWARHLNISCGCFDLKIFGLGESHPLLKFLESVGFAFFRNLLLTALAFILLRNRLSELKLAPVPQEQFSKAAKR